MIPRRRGRLVAIGWICILCLLGCARRGANRLALNKQLLAAAEKDDAPAVRRLLQEGADANARGAQGETALMDAVGRGDVDLVKLLLSHGANIGKTALEQSLMTGNAQIVSLLLGPAPSRTLLNQTLFDMIENQPVIVYIGKNSSPGTPDEPPPNPVATLLVDRGADLGARDIDGSTPLEDAAAFGQLAIVKALVAKGANLEAKDNSGNTPLLSAACDCAVATMPDTDVVVEYLLEHGAKINARNNQGDTALMIASGGGVIKRSIVAILIQHGANLRLRNKNEQTALMIARHDRVADVAQLLETALAKSR